MQNSTPQKNAAVFLISGVFLLLIIIDQLSKYFAKNLFLNYQFAFSLPVPPALMYFIYSLVLLAIIYHIAAHHHRLSFKAKLAWTFILAGASSNITERIILGYVRDFIYITFYKWTGVYNLADFFIIVGIIILLAG